MNAETKVWSAQLWEVGALIFLNSELSEDGIKFLRVSFAAELGINLDDRRNPLSGNAVYEPPGDSLLAKRRVSTCNCGQLRS